jgi:hypothetical protein
MRIWAKDAKLVSGRSAKRDEYDHELRYAAFRRSAQLRSKGKADAKLELAYRDQHVTIDGDRATVTWTIQVRWRSTRDGTTGREDTAERWELRRTPDGWRVTENRFWPLRLTVADQTVVFDEAHWRKKDAAVTLAQASDDPLRTIGALWEAWRLKEALEVARKLTADRPGDPTGWAWRARVANRMRLVVEALEAYERLRVIDPRADVPGWVEHMLGELRKLGR